MQITIIIAGLAGLLVALVLLVGFAAIAEPQTRTFYNDKGQQTGRAVTQGNRTTFTNEKGQQTGSAIRQQDGSTFYNSKGQQTGRSSR
jgi:hypothetical protein